MACRAGRHRCVRSRQGELRHAVIERRRLPCRRRMTRRAIGREPRRHVGRIGRPVEIRLMTPHTRRRKRGEIVVHVARRT